MDPDRLRSLCHLALLLAASAVLFFLFLGQEGLTDPDESAHAESVREMLASGDWLVPHLYDQPLLDKPILFYWLVGASFEIFGPGEFAARLPSALAALAGLLVAYRLGWLVHGTRRHGVLTALVLATSLEYALLARSAVTDMILTTLCAAAILLYLETLENPARRGLPLAAAAFLGLAVLNKGPVGFVIPALALGLYLAATRSLRRLRDLRPVAGGGVFLAVAVPWYLVVAASRPDLVEKFFLAGNVGRFFTLEHRSEPPLYYLVVLFVGFLPWSAFLPGALVRAFRRSPGRPGGNRRPLLPACWLLTTLLFFTLAAIKLPSYILPLFPPAAILVAGPLHRWFEPSPREKIPPGTGAMTLLVLLAGGVLLFAWQLENLGSIPLDFKVALLPVCLAAFLGSLLALGFLLAGRSRLTFFLLAGANLVLLPALLWFGFPLLDPLKSSRQAAATVASRLRPSDGVLLFHENHPGFAYYLSRVPELVQAEPHLEELFTSDRRYYCLMGRDRYEKLKTSRPALPLFLFESVGHVVVVTNRPPGVPP